MHLLKQPLSLILFIALTNITYAQNKDYQELPINLTADSGEYDAVAGLATYTGHVVIEQGQMNITGDKVSVHVNEGEVTMIEAWGNLATFHYVPEQEPPIDGKGKYMKYTIATTVVDIDEQAFVKQEKNETTGDHLSYNLEKERVSGQRVQMLLFPKSSQ